MVDANLSQKIEVYFSGRNLPRLDLKSETDAFCVIYTFNNKSKNWQQVGKTEVVKDTPNPDFVTQFLLEYRFEEFQKFKVDVWDEDKYTKPDYVGSCEFNLGGLMGSRGQTLQIQLLNPKKPHQKKATLLARAEVVRTNNDFLKFSLCGKSFDNKDGWFGKSDPFLEIQRSREGNEWVSVHKTEVVMNNLSPTWKPMNLSLQKLCNGDVHRPIRFVVWDWEKDGRHDFIGEFTTTVDRMLAYKDNKPYHVMNEKKKRKKGKKYINSGTVHVQRIELVKGYSLLEFISGGLQISLVSSIDFTGSNGDPRYPTSLHFLSQNPQQHNLYESALHSVGQIVIEYDSDKLVPCYGFGAVTPGSNVANHCFPLTFNPATPAVYHVQGMVQVYRHALAQVILSGPTLFSPVIQEAMRQCQQEPVTQTNQNYSILLILTDGVINDLDQTIALIVQASRMPLSIIIVGVGQADFSAMDVLDGDGKLLRDRSGNVAARDIVQFVPFSKFSGDGIALAAEVLREVPDQITEYMRMKGIKPNPAQTPGDFGKQIFQESLGAATQAMATTNLNPNKAQAQPPQAPYQAQAQPSYPSQSPGYPTSSTGATNPSQSPGYPTSSTGATQF